MSDGFGCDLDPDCVVVWLTFLVCRLGGGLWFRSRGGGKKMEAIASYIPEIQTLLTQNLENGMDFMSPLNKSEFRSSQRSAENYKCRRETNNIMDIYIATR